MKTLKTFEEWNNPFKKKVLTPEEKAEYGKKARKKFGFYTKTGDDVNFGKYIEEDEKEAKEKSESELQRKLKNLKNTQIDPYDESDWDVDAEYDKSVKSAYGDPYDK